jgi:hypothetical protein
MREGGYITDSSDDIHNSSEPRLAAREISIERAGLSADANVDKLCVAQRNARPYGQICDVFAKATLQNSQKTDPNAWREKLAQSERSRTVAFSVGARAEGVGAHALPTTSCGQIVDDS